MAEKPKITIEVTTRAPLARAWKTFTDPDSIVKWNHASDDWTCPRASNDPRTGGSFDYRMESRDGKAGFDFAGTYLEVVGKELIRFTIGDREVRVAFVPAEGGTRVVETFEAEDENSLELQRKGWLAILENFKKEAEGKQKGYTY